MPIMMKLADNSTAWYLVQCRPQSENRAEFNLRNQHFECFLPRRRVQRKRADALHWFTEPLFPNYLFIRLSEGSNWKVIRSTRGVARIVSFGEEPSRVPEQVIAGLQNLCEEHERSEPEAFCRPGDKALITEGCFKDLEAIVQAVNGDERVVLLLNLLNRAQSIEMPVSAIRKVT